MAAAQIGMECRLPQRFAPHARWGRQTARRLSFAAGPQLGPCKPPGRQAGWQAQLSAPTRPMEDAAMRATAASPTREMPESLSRLRTAAGGKPTQQQQSAGKGWEEQAASARSSVEVAAAARQNALPGAQQAPPRHTARPPTRHHRRSQHRQRHDPGPAAQPPGVGRGVVTRSGQQLGEQAVWVAVAGGVALGAAGRAGQEPWGCGELLGWS